MHIRYGYRIDVICDAPTLLVTTLDIHPSRRSDITTADNVVARALGHVRTSSDRDVPRWIRQLSPRLTMPAGGSSSGPGASSIIPVLPKTRTRRQSRSS